MAKRRLGQNFLFDPSILHKIVEAAQITPDDTVVEIGPGHGRLTGLLSQVAKKVIAIEIDRGLCEGLKEELKPKGSEEGSAKDELITAHSGYSQNIELVCGDALKFPYEQLESFKVVSNIPYYITTPLVFRLIEARKSLKSMTLTIQREVAERIVAKPHSKEYGALTIGVQYYGAPELRFVIPKGAFRPVPKVDSAVIHVIMHETPPVRASDERLFFRIVKTAFLQRRKTLSNALKSLVPEIRTYLVRAGIDPMRRAETLSIEEFAKISGVVAETMNQRSV